jgi:hypothetical protein
MLARAVGVGRRAYVSIATIAPTSSVMRSRVSGADPDAHVAGATTIV